MSAAAWSRKDDAWRDLDARCRVRDETRKQHRAHASLCARKDGQARAGFFHVVRKNSQPGVLVCEERAAKWSASSRATVGGELVDNQPADGRCRDRERHGEPLLWATGGAALSFLTSLLTFIIGLGLLVALIWTWNRCRVRLRAKGYGWIFTIVGSVVLMEFCFVIAGLLVDRLKSDVAVTLGLPALWIGLAIPLTRLLPDRSPAARHQRRLRRGERRAGARGALRASIWAWTATTIGGLMILFFTWQLIAPSIVPRDQGWKAWLAVVAMTAAISHYWFNVVRRTKAAPEVLPASSAAVLYLRAFDDEQQPFVFGPRSALRKYTNQLSAHMPMQRGDPTIRLTLEDYFDEAIAALIGPFVALGNPYDRLAPDGATREYAPDDRWQTRFLELAQSVTCIVVSIGGSPNLEWELTQIKERGLGNKLCLFTSPIVPGTDEKMLNRLRSTTAKRAKGIDEDWTRANTTLGRAGFVCGGNPGPGAAVTFDEHGVGMLLTTDATSPTDFMAPVADWFKRGQKSGRCVPVTCRSCGAPTHVTPALAADGGLCEACRKREERAQLPFFDRHPAIMGLWGFATLVIAVLFATLIHLVSVWIIVPIWLGIIALSLQLPRVVRAGVRRLRGRSVSVP
jgi:hypothetical protein